MNPQLNQPTGKGPDGDERRLRLQSAYLVMIRAYLRGRQGQPGGAAAAKEAKDG